MRKIVWAGILFISLILVIVIVLNVMGVIVKNSLKEKVETEHFVFYYSGEDKYFLSYLPDSLENDYKRISSHLKAKFDKKIIIRIFPNPQSYRMSFGNPLPWPVQVGASAGKESITVVSQKYLDVNMKIENVLAHEMTHELKNEINPSVKGGWLSEGIAAYEANDRPYTWILMQISNELENGRIPMLKELDDCTYQQFLNKKGYEFSYTIVEFIIHEYGYDKLIELLKSPNDFMGIFKLTDAEFYNKWVEFLKGEYF